MPTPSPLTTQWQITFGHPPPHRASITFLRGTLAYHHQCHQHGGLNPLTRRHLLQLAENAHHQPNTRIPHTRPGTKLIRLWQGEPHEVTILGAKRYLYRNQTFSSLSAIASSITGTRWNGNTFFRLRHA